MTVDKLPDFISCLKFMMAARRHLVYFYHMQDPAGSTGEKIEIERQATLLKNIVERLYIHEGIRCYELKSIPQEGLPNLSNEIDPALEVIIIPRLQSLTKKEEGILVRTMMMSSQGSAPVRLFIGMISWNMRNESRISEDIESALSSPVTLGDWLKHRFWLACSEPREDAVVSPLMEPSHHSLGCLQYADVHANRSIHRYILDVMIHLRMHKLLDTTKGGGVHTSALKDVLELSKLIALSKFNKRFVTPEFVKLACVWYFPLHLEILKRSEMDPSILYGSRPELVEGLLKGVADVKARKSVETKNPLFLETLIIQDVLDKVVPPV